MDKYKLISEKYVKDIDTNFRILKHIKSGAKVLTMKNTDDNKVFSIAFSTPAGDSSGLAHIMEHSVLCGSRKFPLKDPFVELAKGSLNTFLNAITYPDKTVYPIASRNKKDFENLMDVYLDAVFYPNCVNDERTFAQEGWHYEIDPETSELFINGVVYNEMKGVFSNPESVLDREIMHRLYPQNEYSNESGGDPACIPNLTFEDFKNFHKKYYHPSNSFIILYGDIDMDERLDYMDKEYLSVFDEISIDATIKKQERFNAPKEYIRNYPLLPSEDEKNNTYLSLNYMIEDNLDPKLNLAFDILSYILISGPSAKLKQAVIKEGICEDLTGGYGDGLLQPYFTLIAKSANAEDNDKFKKLVKKTLEDIVDKGIPEKLILAPINNDEFKFREADYGRIPKGLMYALDAMDSWLYGGKPWIHMELSSVYDELKADVSKGYFEELIKKYLIDNTHLVSVILKPEKGLQEKRDKDLKEKLLAYKESLLDEEIEKIDDFSKKLKVYQEVPTSEEDLMKLPLLDIEDIDRKADMVDYEIKDLDGRKLIFRELDTRGIAYLSFNFNIDGLSDSEISYASFIKTLLGQIDTKKRGYEDLSSDILLETGGISCRMSAFKDFRKKDSNKKIFEVSLKLLYDKLNIGLSLINEMLHESVFTDKNRIYELLMEAKSRSKMNIEYASHTEAIRRSSSYYSECDRFNEYTYGISYYRFLDKTLSEIEENEEYLDKFIKKLENIQGRIFREENMIVSISSERTALNDFEKHFSGFMNDFRSTLSDIECSENPGEFKVEIKNEAFKTASTVNYVARTGMFDTDKYPYTGSLRVLKLILNYEYLWVNLRTKGGAYGCMSGFGRSGNSYLVSYRDPKLKESLDVYRALPEYLENFTCSERDMRKYIIGAIAELDIPKNNQAKALAAFVSYISGTDNEFRQKLRNEILETKVSDIRALAPYIRDILNTGAGCTIGNAALIDRDKDEFKTVENLF